MNIPESFAELMLEIGRHVIGVYYAALDREPPSNLDRVGEGNLQLEATTWREANISFICEIAGLAKQALQAGDTRLAINFFFTGIESSQSLQWFLTYNPYIKAWVNTAREDQNFTKIMALFIMLGRGH